MAQATRESTGSETVSRESDPALFTGSLSGNGRSPSSTEGWQIATHAFAISKLTATRQSNQILEPPMCLRGQGVRPDRYTGSEAARALSYSRAPRLRYHCCSTSQYYCCRIHGLQGCAQIYQGSLTHATSRLAYAQPWSPRGCVPQASLAYRPPPTLGTLPCIRQGANARVSGARPQRARAPSARRAARNRARARARLVARGCGPGESRARSPEGEIHAGREDAVRGRRERRGPPW